LVAIPETHDHLQVDLVHGLDYLRGISFSVHMKMDIDDREFGLPNRRLLDH